MADPAMSAAISGDLLDMVADLQALANRVEGDRRRLWIEITDGCFKVRRQQDRFPHWDDLGVGGTVDMACERARAELHRRQAEYTAINDECDRLDRAERAARHAAE